MSATSDMSKAKMEEMKVHTNDAAIEMKNKGLIPALTAFIDSLNSVASFFEIMKQDLTTFNSQGKKGIKNNGIHHYMTMKENAKEIKEHCKSFYAIIPKVQTDVQCIPQIR